MESRSRAAAPLDAGGEHSLVSQLLLVMLLVLGGSLGLRLLERAYKTIAAIASDPLSLVAFVLSSGGAAMLVARWMYRERASNETPERAEGSAALIAQLAVRMAIEAPQVEMSGQSTDARVAVKRGRSIIIVSQAMEWVARVRPEAVRAVFAHELAHVANGDGWRAATARRVVVWMAFSTVIFVAGDVAVQLGMFARLAWERQNLLWLGEAEIYRLLERLAWPVAYSACMAAAYAAFLRMREFEADLLVARLGMGHELKRALQEGSVQQSRFLPLHPRRDERIRALESGRETYRVEAITMALVVVVLNLSVGLISSMDSSIPAFAAMNLLLLVGVFVVGLLGLDLGRKAIEDGDSPGDRAKNLVRVGCAVYVGALVAGAAQDMVEAYQAQIPFHMQLWETMRGAWATSAGTMLGFIVAYFVGSAAAHQRSARAREVALRLLAFIAAYLCQYATFLFAVADAYGNARDAIFWSSVKSFWESDLGQRLGLGELPTQVPVTFWMGMNVLIVALVSMVATGAVASWWLRHRQTSRGQGGRVPRSILSLSAALCSPVCFTLLACYVTYQLSDEYRMRDTLWLVCTDHRPNPDQTGMSDFSQRLVEATVRRANAIDTRAPQIWVGRLTSLCNEGKNDRYPVRRKILGLVVPVHDAYAKLEVHRHRVDLRYESKECGSRSIYSGYGVSVGSLVEPLAEAHAPYRLLYERLRATGRVASDEEGLQAVMAGCRREDRAWAHNLYGFQRYVSEPAVARYHLEQALAMQPSNGIFAGNFALWLIAQDRCGEAGPYVKLAARSGRISTGAVLAYVRCLFRSGHADDAVSFVWSLRRILAKPTFAVALGEASLWANKHALARQYFTSLGEVRLAESDGCGRLFAALYRDVTVCDSNRCRAPIEPETADEKWCWATYAARYGHRLPAK